MIPAWAWLVFVYGALTGAAVASVVLAVFAALARARRGARA